jgi:MFS transporter, PPP family, 3-phenylpropionic acid transporter
LISNLAPRTRVNPQIRRVNRAYILVGVAEASFVPFLPIFLLERGFDAAQIGVVTSAAGLASFIAAPVWAQLADRGWRAERALMFACAAAAVVVLVLALPGPPLLVAAGLIALWVTRAPIGSLLDAIALHRLGAARTTGYARIRMRMSAGWAASAILLGGLLQVTGYRLIPFLYAPLIAVFALWAWRSIGEGLPPAAATAARPRSGMTELRGAVAALSGFLASVFLLGVAFGATGNYITLQIDFLGGGAILIGAAAAFQAFTEVPTMAYMHVLVARFGTRRLYALGCAIYLAVFVSWAFVTSPVWIALLRLVCGVGFGFIAVAAVVITDELIPAQLRATGQALMKSTMFGLAPIVGTLGGGFVYAALGPSTLFIASGVLAAAAGVVGLTAVARRRVAVQPVSAPEPVEPAPLVEAPAEA